MVGTNQGGSVLSFVIIAIVLVVLFVGGVVFSHNQQTTSSEGLQPTPPSKPQSSQAPPRQDVPSTQQPSTQSSPQASPSSSGQGGSTANTQLPHTGPNEDVLAAVVFGLITLAVISFARSRRPVFLL